MSVARATWFESQVLQHPWRVRVFLVLFCLALYLPGLSALPPLDRDESRFIQSTKQMLETGQYADIRFQAEPRYKKPIGIYWLQALSVKTIGQNNLLAVWAYRLPSLLMATLGVILLNGFASRWFNSRVGFLSATMMASAVMLVIEAHIAKTDATLFGLTVLTLGSLGTCYLSPQKPTWLPAFCFWIGLALGILIKGPVLPFIVVMTALGVLLSDTDRSWIKRLYLLPGCLLLLALVLPWFLFIHHTSHGQFWHEFWVHDFLSKTVSGQESHGALPGFYIVTSLFGLFPASLFALPTIIFSIRHWQTPVIRFCLAWLIPSWIVMELMPTKMVHYVLPLYAPLIMLIAWFIVVHAERLRPWRWVIAALMLLLVLGAMGVWIFGLGRLGIDISSISMGIACLDCLLFIGLVWGWGLQTQWYRIALGLCMVMPVFLMPILAWGLPHLSPLWLSHQIATRVQAIQPAVSASQIELVGYQEPSSVFLLGTSIQLTDADRAVQTLMPHSRHLVIVEKRQMPSFITALAHYKIGLPQPLSSVSGFNYSKGKKMNLLFYDFTR